MLIPEKKNCRTWKKVLSTEGWLSFKNGHPVYGISLH